MTRSEGTLLVSLLDVARDEILSHRMRRALWTLLLLGSGCSSEVFFMAPEPPAEVKWLAVVVLSSEGAVRSASGLISSDRPVQLVSGAIEDSDTIALLGYESEQLAGLEPPDEEAANTALQAAVGCVTSLPDPAWRRPLSGSLGTVPRLTSSWVRRSCRPLLSDRQGWLSLCDVDHCGQSWRQRGCDLELDLANCGTVLETIPDARIQLGGGVCSPTASCSGGKSPPALGAIECEEEGAVCPLRLYMPKSLEGRAESVQLRAPIPGANLLPTVLAFANQRTGYLSGLVRRDGRIYTIGKQGFSSPEAGPNAEILIVDEQNLRMISAESADGATHIIEDPYGPGLLVAGRIGAVAHYVARHDEDGLHVETSTLAPTSGATDLRPHGLGYATALDEVVLLRSERNTRVNQLIRLDGRTLREKARCSVDGSLNTTGLIFQSDGTAILTENEGDQILWIDVTTCSISALHSMPPGGFDIGHIAAKEDGSGGILMTVNGVQVIDAVYEVDPLSAVGRRSEFYESFGAPTVSAPFRAGQFAVAVSGAEPATARARVALFDLEDHRFLPGSIDLGEGPASHMLTDDQERLLVILPWSGTLVRLDLLP